MVRALSKKGCGMMVAKLRKVTEKCDRQYQRLDDLVRPFAKFAISPC